MKIIERKTEDERRRLEMRLGTIGKGGMKEKWENNRRRFRETMRRRNVRPRKIERRKERQTEGKVERERRKRGKCRKYEQVCGKRKERKGKGGEDAAGDGKEGVGGREDEQKER